MRHEIFLEEIEPVTPRVSRLRFTRPDHYDFTPGQATELALDRPGWRDEKRPFTFTGPPEAPFLEFVIKSYPDHDGVTKRIPHLTPGARVTIGDPWGAISDKGPGVFIAGGAGVTPFIPILRARDEAGTLDGCTLILADENWEQLILRAAWQDMAGLRTEWVLSDEDRDGCHKGHVDREVLQSVGVTSDSRVYLCGPPPMEDAVGATLSEIGIPEDTVIREA